MSEPLRSALDLTPDRQLAFVNQLIENNPDIKRHLHGHEIVVARPDPEPENKPFVQIPGADLRILLPGSVIVTKDMVSTANMIGGILAGAVVAKPLADAVQHSKPAAPARKPIGPRSGM